MLRKIVLFFILVLGLGVVSAVSAAPNKYCFEIYGSSLHGGDTAVYSGTFTDGSTGNITITKKSSEEPDWMLKTTNFNGFSFASNMQYEAMAGGTQYRSVVFGPIETFSTEKWLLIETIDGNYSTRLRWDSRIPFAADWRNDQLVIASPYGTDSVKIQVFTVAGKDSQLPLTVSEFVYTEQPTGVLGLHWVTCAK